MKRLWTLTAAVALLLTAGLAAPASAAAPTVSILCESSSNGSDPFRDFSCTASVTPSMGGYTASWSIQTQGWLTYTNPYEANGYCYVTGIRTRATVTLTMTSPTHTFNTSHNFWCYYTPV